MDFARSTAVAIGALSGLFQPVVQAAQTQMRYSTKISTTWTSSRSSQCGWHLDVFWPKCQSYVATAFRED